MNYLMPILTLPQDMAIINNRNLGVTVYKLFINKNVILKSFWDPVSLLILLISDVMSLSCILVEI